MYGKSHGEHCWTCIWVIERDNGEDSLHFLIHTMVRLYLLVINAPY